MFIIYNQDMDKYMWNKEILFKLHTQSVQQDITMADGFVKNIEL